MRWLKIMLYNIYFYYTYLDFILQISRNQTIYLRSHFFSHFFVMSHFLLVLLHVLSLSLTLYLYLSLFLSLFFSFTLSLSLSKSSPLIALNANLWIYNSEKLHAIHYSKKKKKNLRIIIP